jgi:hypothetical protein
MTELSTAAPASAETRPAAPESNDDRPSGAPARTPLAEPVSTVLARLADRGWRTLEDRVSNGPPRIMIDHITIGPGGIFAIDSHSLAGMGPDFSVISDANQPAKLAAAQAVADAIRSLLPPLSRQFVIPVIAYVDQSPMSMSCDSGRCTACRGFDRGPRTCSVFDARCLAPPGPSIPWPPRRPASTGGDAAADRRRAAIATASGRRRPHR